MSSEMTTFFKRFTAAVTCSTETHPNTVELIESSDAANDNEKLMANSTVDGDGDGDGDGDVDVV